MKRLVFTIVLILFVTVLLSCSNKEQPDRRDATVYALNPDGNGLTGRAITFAAYDTDGRIGEMIEALKETSQGKYRAALPNRSFVLKYSYSDGVLRLENYGQFEIGLFGLEKSLSRAAVVKSFCSIGAIDAVVFERMGEDGEDVVLGAASYPDTLTFAPVRQKVTLYFGNEERSGLLECTEYLETDGSQSVIYDILYRLIAGPNELPGIAVIPPETKVLGVSISNGHCVVDLDSAFLKELNAVPAALTVYSIVNTLTQLPTVQEVEFTVEGKSIYSYLGFDMNRVFRFHPGLISN